MYIRYSAHFCCFSGCDLYPDEPKTERRVRRARRGFYGWQGFGGSVLQWRHDLGISFAYVPTLLTW